MKRIFPLLLFFCLILNKNAFAFDISAECACLINGETKQVIYEKNSRKQHSMASTTKIMTALLALEYGNGEDEVTISGEAAMQEGSSVYLRKGERVLLKDLLYGMMLNSGNDAAFAIAEHIGGNAEEFCKSMTKRANAVGACNTSFKNPNGLDEEGHFSTAYDMALIAREALKNDKFRELAATKEKQIAVSSGVCYLKNHNKLLWRYDGCIGVKTGFTKKTGRCLVSAANREGVELICVTLNAPDDWNDHTKMLDYGFSNTEIITPVKKGEILKRIESDNGTFCARAAEDISVSKLKNSGFNGEIILHTIKKPHMNISENEKIGYAELVNNGEVIKKVDLLCDRNVEAEENKSFIKRILEIVGYIGK